MKKNVQTAPIHTTLYIMKSIAETMAGLLTGKSDV
jgi:hypothetical protein